MLTNGQQIAHYKIISSIGAGGMGEVFLAEDIKLGRCVALKFLPAQALENTDHLRRFEQEARAASRLNHPNIAHIYEIGESDGVNFIAMEYVEGESLSDRISSGSLSAFEIVRIGEQIADALDEAHLQEIVHRDIKSQNVMINRRGQVKVLDFGLAKVSEKIESEESTRVKTSPGVVMGTVAYMSPEQALGREADARTDVWSLGIILYEMATGRLPFQGESVTETIDKIAHSQPEAIARLNYDVPPELEIIIKKALRKNRDERYQSARDVLVDLENLKRELQLSEHSTAPNQRSANDGITANEEAKTLTFKQTTDKAKAPVQTTSSAEYIFTEIKRHKIGFAVASSVFILLLAAGIFGLYKFVSQQSPTVQKAQTNSPSFQAMKITKLTDTGKTGRAAISPDGKYVVHTVEDGEQQSLWVRHVGTGSNVQIIPPAEFNYGRMTFSPDGDYIYFGRFDKNAAAGVNALYRVPVLGGEPEKVMENASSAITFAPDGRRFASVRSNLAQGETFVIIANADGSGEQRIATRKQPDVFRWNGPAWSPDGKLIAIPSVGYDNGTYQYISLVSVADGAIEPLGTSRWTDVGRVGWLADGSGLVASCEDENSVVSQYYLFSYPDGEPRRITNDLNDYHDLSLTADSATLATVKEERAVNIWVAPDGEASKIRQLTRGSEKYEGNSGVHWTPDGRIVFEMTANGPSNIWIMNGDGTGRKQLTAASGKDDNESPAVSPDGRYIVYLSYRSGKELWRMNIDGSNPINLTMVGGGGVHNLSAPPSFSPDGSWVIYQSRGIGKNGIWKIPIDGGEPVQISDRDTSQPVVSPDGKLIACFYREENAPYKVAIIPFEGGSPTKFFDIPIAVGSSPGLGLRQILRWMPDSRDIAYMDIKNGVSNIWAQPIDGGEPRQLTNFTSGEIFWFDLARDGKPSLFSRGEIKKDVVLISNFKQ
jgi:eukaryotic-like serine/threonine-protein kinase